ncbi:MAG: DUF58 domain-containing protein [Nanoarchaeota archaeon]
MNSRALVLIFISLFCITYGIVFERIELMLIGISLACYLFFTYLFLRIRTSGIEIVLKKDMARSSHEKEDIHILVNIEVNSPMVFDVTDDAPEKNIIKGENKVCNARGKATLDYTLRFDNYCVFKTGPVKIAIHDMQRLFYWEKQAGETYYVLVYPSLFEISKIKFKITEKTLSNLLGTRKTSEKGMGNEFMSIRRYETGDDIRNIDWKATAKLDTLMVKTFEIERKQRIFLLLDVGKEMNTGEKASMIDTAVYSMIYLSQLILERKDMLGIGLYADAIQLFSQQVNSRNQLMNLFEQVSFQTFDKETDHERCFHQLSVYIKKRCGLIIISNLVSEKPEKIFHAVQYLASKSHSIHLICPFEPYFFQKEENSLLDKISYLVAKQRYDKSYDELYTMLKKIGVTMHKTGPDNIGMKLTEIYLDIVKRNLAAV